MDKYTVVELLREQQIKVIHTFGSGSDKTDITQESRRKKLAAYNADVRVKVTTVHCFEGWESKALVCKHSKSSGSGLHRYYEVEMG